MFREDFPMLNNDIIYFDNGATTLKPNCVIDTIEDYYKNYSVNIHRGDYKLSYKADVAYDDARKVVAKFINSEFDEIVFTSGTTESINLVVNGYFKKVLKKDDEVLITYSEHASNILPWYRLAKTNGIKVKFIELDDDHTLNTNSVINAITSKTKVISLAHITNVLGDIRDVEDIVKYAHKIGIKVLVDGAQSVPHLKTDVKILDCDFLCFSGHKMYGPTGVGVLYGKRELLEKIEPVNLGGGMNETFDISLDYKLHDVPRRLEAGTPNIAGVIGLGAAVNYLENIGMDKICRYEHNLRRYLLSELSKIKHIKLVNSDIESSIVSFNIDGIFAQDVAIYLDKYNICVRAGNHCAKILKNEIGEKNTVRVSLGLYNTKEEVDKLVLLLSDKDKIISEMI